MPDFPHDAKKALEACQQALWRLESNVFNEDHRPAFLGIQGQLSASIVKVEANEEFAIKDREERHSGWAKAQSAYRFEIEKQRASLAEKNTRITALEARITALEAENGALQVTSASLQNDVASLQAQLLQGPGCYYC